jgi:hypothetical protein
MSEPTPMSGDLCEQCLDAPAVAFVPAPGGWGELSAVGF